MKMIQADVYDVIELSAHVYGGIGAHSNYDGAGNPNCLAGHINGATAAGLSEEVREAVEEPFIGGLTFLNDQAVLNINARKGVQGGARVSFEEYVAERGWVRGE